MQCTHRGFLESASRQNCCDHLNALFLQQLLADSSSACICIHACRSMQSGVRRQLLKRHCVQVVTKNTVHQRRSALSRKPLWMYLSPPSKSGSSSNDGWSSKFLSRLSKNGRKKTLQPFFLNQYWPLSLSYSSDPSCPVAMKKMETSVLWREIIKKV